MLINKEVIDHYAVSMETKRIWITLNAEEKSEVDELLAKSPMFKYWIYEIDELYVLDFGEFEMSPAGVRARPHTGALWRFRSDDVVFS